MRKVFFNLLASDEAFMALLPGGLYGDRALDGTPTLKPFGIITMEGPTPGISRHWTGRATLWVHDSVGDYTRIDEILLAAKGILEPAPPTSLAGAWLSSVEWTGDSPDLFDDARGTNVKNAGYRLVGNGL